MTGDRPAEASRGGRSSSAELLRLESRDPSKVVRFFALYSLVFRSVGVPAALWLGIPWLALVQALGAVAYALMAVSRRPRTGIFLGLLGPEWVLWGFAMCFAVGVRPYFHIHTIVVTAGILLLLHDLPPRHRILLFVLPLVVPAPSLLLLHATVPEIELPIPTSDFWLFINQLLGMGFLLVVIGIAVLDHARARRIAEERSEAQSRLVEDLSHELRTPIATILTAAQGARASQGVPEPTAEFLEWIEDSARAGGRLVERMLDLATLERGRRPEPEPEHLGSAVRAVVDRLRPLAASRSISLRLLDDGASGLTVDAASLEVVLQNLINNAIGHSHSGTAIDIRLADENGKVRIDVEDRGQGIAAEDLPHVFDRMWRADRNRARDEGRFGLGLSIAERHAALLGATIEARSEPGAGSVFSLVFH